jgi:ABC-type amino acid transport substrate-binding protein
VNIDEDLDRVDWRKSSFCAATGCVEVARIVSGSVLVRDSKMPNGSALSYSPEEWSAFIAGAKAGEFDLS